MKIEAYLAQGWEVHYVAVTPYPYHHPNLIPHLLPTPMQRHDSVAFWIYFFLTAPWFVLFHGLKARVNLISVFSAPYAQIGSLLKWVRGIPLILFINTVPNEPLYAYKGARWAQRIEACLDQWGLWVSDMAIANSHTGLAAFRKTYVGFPEHSAVLPNHLPKVNGGPSTQRASLLKEFNLPDEAFIVVTSGRLHPGKNLECLINALVPLRGSRAVALILGDGEQMDALRDLSREQGVEDRVIFAGWRRDVMDLVSSSDLFVLPSFKEGMSNSLIEAMACGVPCLVSAIPENQEVIRQPDQQFPPDQPAALAACLRKCLEDETYYARIKQQTLQEAARYKFDWSVQLIETVRPWLQRAKPPTP